MKDEIEVLVNQNDVADIITRLSQIEDIQVAIQTNELSEPDPNAKHWTYNLSPQEVTAIIISIAGTTTSLISLATAIIELRTENKKSKDKKGTQDFLVIKVNKNTIVVADSDKPEKLAAMISTALSELKDKKSKR